MKVMVFRCPCGTRPIKRSPRGPRPLALTYWCRMRKSVAHALAIDIVPQRANHAGRLAHPNRRTNRKIARGGFRFEYCSPTTVRIRILRATNLNDCGEPRAAG